MSTASTSVSKTESPGSNPGAPATNLEAVAFVACCASEKEYGDV